MKNQSKLKLIWKKHYSKNIKIKNTAQKKLQTLKLYKA